MKARSLAASAAILFISSPASAGPYTYQQCQAAISLSSYTKMGQTAWLAFCKSSLYATALYPEAGTYDGSCIGVMGASVESKKGFCRNFIYDNGQTP